MPLPADAASAPAGLLPANVAAPGLPEHQLHLIKDLR